VPFRESHAVVGRLVRYAEENGLTLRTIPDHVLAEAHPAFQAGPRPSLSAADSVEARAGVGGTARAAILDQIEAARAALD